MWRRVLTTGAVAAVAVAAIYLVATFRRQRPADALPVGAAQPERSLLLLPSAVPPAVHRPPAAPMPEVAAAPAVESDSVVPAPSIPSLRPPAAPGAIPPARPVPPPAAGPSLAVSPAVLAIVGIGPEREDAKARRAAINRLTVDLSAEDRAALVAFLRTPHGEDAGVSATIYNTLRNDVLEVLVRQEQLPDGLGGLMVSMLRNRDEDAVWRDYSAQYMAEYYQRRWAPDTPATDDAERQEMLAAYRETLTQKDGTLAGTALIGFETLSRRYAEVPRAEVAARALALAVDEECYAGVRRSHPQPRLVVLEGLSSKVLTAQLYLTSLEMLLKSTSLWPRLCLPQ